MRDYRFDSASQSKSALHFLFSPLSSYYRSNASTYAEVELQNQGEKLVIRKVEHMKKGNIVR